MSGSAYLDTSTLAKWYFSEANSEAVEKYIIALDSAIVSPLVKIEMRCLCARKRRDKAITPILEMQAYATFENDIEQGYLQLYPVDKSIYERAGHLMDLLNTHPLRTLDALHLSIAQYHRVPRLATSDQVMAKAARDMDFEVDFF